MKKLYLLLTLLIGAFVSLNASAATPFENVKKTNGSVGVHCWGLLPFTDVICFDVDSKGFVFALHGTDKVQSGSEGYNLPISGAAADNPFNGTIGLQWNFVGLTFLAAIDPITLDGEWAEESGQSGDFIYLGLGPMAQSTESTVGGKMFCPTCAKGASVNVFSQQ